MADTDGRFGNNQETMSQQLAAGVGIADITPPPGIPQGGWGAQLHQRSRGNDLPLQVHALELQQGPAICALVDVDAIGFDPQTTRRLLDAISRLAGIPARAIRLSCTRIRRCYRRLREHVRPGTTDCRPSATTASSSPTTSLG